MKKIILLIPLVFVVILDLSSQVIYSSKIDSLINLVSVQSISRMNKELSGDTTVIVSGIDRKIYSRYYLSSDNAHAARYIYEKFLSFGLTPKYMVNNTSNINVYAVKSGTKFPNKKIIIGAHYDDIISPTLPGIYDTIHGADDNASGVCAVLESARLLANTDLDYTVIFAAFDEEEMGLFGSKAFADSCYLRGDLIIGMLNLDMIGWDGNNDSRFAVLTDTNSDFMHRVLLNCLKTYNFDLNFFKIYYEHWDEGSFQRKGYKAICMTEEARSFFNPYYHTVNETFDKFNVPYFQKMVKAAVGFLMTLAMDKYLNVNMDHTPLTSTYLTATRVAALKLNTDIKISSGTNAPRLYYKTGNGDYRYSNSFRQSNDTLFFPIPGFPRGTKVSYYFALQSSKLQCVCTLPLGGQGINPPGTVPPPSVFEYDVLNINDCCSKTAPREIKDNQITADTIRIQDRGLLNSISLSLNINHANDGDLVIVLSSPNAGSVTLCSSIGEGGQNFTNTIFDDTSSTSISLGTPPFTGRFKPSGSLAILRNKEISGNWVLKIYDKNAGNTGTLLNWCIQTTYATTVGMNEISSTVPNEYKLFRNYPNPFNPTTNIRYQIPKSSLVTLKVYDILGKEIETLVNEIQQAGVYETQFPGKSNNNLGSRIYFCKLTAGDFTAVQKMVLIK